jgi:hypothetical protein
MRYSLAGPAIGLFLTTAPIGQAAEIVTPSSVPVTQTVVTLGAGVNTLIGANTSRRYLCLMNIGTGLVTLGFDQPAVAGSGWAIQAATAAGQQGGSMCWEHSTVASSDIHAISAAGSTLVVLEGR